MSVTVEVKNSIEELLEAAEVDSMDEFFVNSIQGMIELAIDTKTLDDIHVALIHNLAWTTALQMVHPEEGIEPLSYEKATKDTFNKLILEALDSIRENLTPEVTH